MTTKISGSVPEANLRVPTTFQMQSLKKINDRYQKSIANYLGFSMFYDNKLTENT